MLLELFYLTTVIIVISSIGILISITQNRRKGIFFFCGVLTVAAIVSYIGFYLTLFKLSLKN